MALEPSRIQKIKARQIIDCRGEPTLEVDVIIDVGLLRSSVPANVTAQQPDQAREMRDGNPALYRGRSVFKAVDIINKVIGLELVKARSDICQQRQIDEWLIKNDGTPNKSKFGVNTILGVSATCCKAGAAKKGLPLYRYIAEMAQNHNLQLPVPNFTMLCGGRFGPNTLFCQEFGILPTGAESFADAVRMATDVYQVLKEKIIEDHRINGQLPVNDIGAFVPKLESNTDALTLLNECIRIAGYEGKIKIALDVAATAFFKEGKYNVGFKTDRAELLGAEALRNRYLDYIKAFPAIDSLEDPFARDDKDGWLTLADQDIQVVSDALTAMIREKITDAFNMNLANTLMLRISQIGTVTELIDYATEARLHNWGCIIGGSPCDTEESFIADLAVGLSVGQFKAGAPCRSERVAKYNRLLQIEEELGRDARYVGSNYRNL